jgi:hypothetical protein
MFCAVSGSVVPRPIGKNVFNVAASFAGENCQFNDQTLRSVAVVATIGGRRALAGGGLIARQGRRLSCDGLAMKSTA